MARTSSPLARRGFVTLGLVITTVVLGVVYAFALVSLRPATPGKQISLSEVLRRSDAKALSSVTFLQEDSRFKGVSTLDPPVFWASAPKELLPGLTDRFVRDGASVSVDNQFGKSTVRFLAQFLLPILLLVTLFTLLFLLIREGGSGVGEFLKFGTVGDRETRDGETRTTFADIGGAGDAVVEVREIAQFLTDPSTYAEIGAEPPSGILLVGPPGCGKTLLARALAGEASVPFLYLSGAEFVESLVGVGAARVRDLFARARANTPAIVFIDELDAVGRRRGSGVGMGHDEREQTLNQLLVEMDGFERFSGVVVIGATNRADILDPALIRPGRFDRRVTVYEPDIEGRRQILEIHARSRKMAPDVSLEQVARETAGLTGADLASVVNEAAVLAVRESRTDIGPAEMAEAIDRVLLGPALRGQRLSDDERRRAAYHEAGHAVVARATGQPVSVQKVSIIARGRSIGHHMARPDGDRVLAGYQQLADELTVTMAGRAAELLVFDDASTASEGDIDNATKLARRLVCLYGMSDKVGRLRIGVPEEEVFMGRDMFQAQHSTNLLDDVDTEIRRLISDGESEASRLLKANRRVLDVVANQLVEVETMTADELDVVLAPIGGAANGATVKTRAPAKTSAPAKAPPAKPARKRAASPSS